MPSILPINIDYLLRLRGVESSRVEFKASWDEEFAGSQVLRTICAFANDVQNLNGGYIVIGVSAPDGVAQLPPVGLAAETIDAVQQWIQGNCNRIEPDYHPILSPETVDNRYVLVVWAPASDNRPHRAPEKVAKEAPKHYYIRQGSQSVKAQDENLRTLMQLTAKVPFDDRRALDAPVERLRESIAREFLSDVRSALVDEPDARVIYRRMRIVSRVNAHEVPRNIGLLFFSDDPEEWFRGARIEVVQFAEGPAGDVLEERTFRGSLHEQLRRCISYLQSLSTQHFEKLGDRPEAKGWVSYPLKALEETLVNALYHRSYEEAEPTKVYLYPERVEVISYPGPVPGIEVDHLQPGAQVPPAPARNRRIGEFLKELKLTEQRGTGIPKLYQAMRENGSPPPRFDFDGARTYFRVTLPAHPEYAAIGALRDAAHLEALGNRRSAVARLRQAYGDHPTSSTLAAALIRALAREGELQESRRIHDAFAARPERQDSARVSIAMANAYFDAGELPRAINVLDNVSTLLSAEDAIDAAVAERRAGRQQKAHEYFEQAGDVVFNDARALHEFAQTKTALARSIRSTNSSDYRVQARIKLLREARDMLRRVLQMDAPPTRHAWAWFDLGRTLRDLGAPSSEVRESFERARGLLPGEDRFRRALERLGQ